MQIASAANRGVASRVAPVPRSVKILIRASDGLSMVELEQTSKTLATNSRLVAGRRTGSMSWKQNPIVAPLAAALDVVMLNVFADCSWERCLAQKRSSGQGTRF